MKRFSPPRRIAVVGAGMAGIACARTLAQAGHELTLFEQSAHAGGRMETADTPFGSFDTGAQYFTVRDVRFQAALATSAAQVKRWSANAVRVLDPLGRVAEAALPAVQAHWVGVPGMDAIARAWVQPLEARGTVLYETRATRIARDALDAARWQLHVEGPGDTLHVHAGFDAVVLAVPAAVAQRLLQASALAPTYAEQLSRVEVAPCWTLMLAFPHAMQPGLAHIGPQWNAALSTHHRVAWLARESSKPGRSPLERWTVQASPAWSLEHFEDTDARVMAKLLKGFAEITGIRAEPAEAQLRRWAWAKTQVPLGRSHLWDSRSGIGLCGDWCRGHRVEDAFVSGLELALAIHGS